MVCPKCGAPIKRFDLSPNCKNCGVHILYYTQEKELAEDAKRTELEFAGARVFTARLKAAFISGAAPVARMILGVLSVAALLLPLGAFDIGIPFFEMKITVGAIGIYKLISDGAIGLFPDFAASGTGGALSALGIAAFICLALCALCILALFFAWIFSFTNIKKTAKAQSIIISLAMLFIIAAETLLITASKKTDASGIISVSPCLWGACGIIAEYAAFLATNIAIIRKTPEIKVSDTDKKRIALLKEIKTGKITYDELPVPIFETEEERLNRENALAGLSKKDKKSRGEDESI